MRSLFDNECKLITTFSLFFIIHSFVSHTTGWLLIYGPQRSGKTLKTLACLHELANEMIEQHNMHEEVSLVFKSVEGM